jgi:sulfonate transport system ATP-binding protein
VLFVTHDVDEALTLADRILVLHSGRLVDDLGISVPRPRTADSLLLEEMMQRKHVLLAHLGLEGASVVAAPTEELT